MVQTTDIERLYLELVAIKELLLTQGDMSAVTNFEALASKSLLLAAASHFERRVTELITEAAKASGTKNLFVEFLKNQALSRKYHTMFDWNSSNLNKFFGLFGNATKQKLSTAVEVDDLPKCIDAFIFLNSERNRLVHQDYATFNLNATSDEIWERFKLASQFCNLLERCLNDPSYF